MGDRCLNLKTTMLILISFYTAFASDLISGTVATSSSFGWNGIASYAVDGLNNNGVYNGDAPVCAHTLKKASWITIDLGASHTIHHIDLVGRSDCCGEQSRDWTIHVGSEGSSNDPICKTNVDVAGGSVHVIECDSNMAGKYVTIVSSTWMVLCEAEVYGHRVNWYLGAPGATCTETCLDIGQFCQRSEMWPQSPTWILDVATSMGITCTASQECDKGEVPLLNGNKCAYCDDENNWKFQDGWDFCGKGWGDRKRFCPCAVPETGFPTTAPTPSPTTAPSPMPTAALDFIYTDESCIRGTLNIGNVLGSEPHTIHMKLTYPTSDSYQYVTCGRVNGCSSGTYVAHKFKELAVRCVSDVYIAGWTLRCGIYTESDHWGGCVRKNYEDAKAFCASMGGRLPTLSEATSNCLHGTGCWYDAEEIWTSDGVADFSISETILELGSQKFEVSGDFFTAGSNTFDSFDNCETISAVYDGTESRLYCNRDLVSTATELINIPDDQLKIGEFFGGCVQEVSVVNEALSQQELPQAPVYEGYCIHEKDPWNDDATESIILHKSEEDCFALCLEDMSLRACTHHSDPETCITYAASNGNFTGSGDEGFKCYIPRTGVRERVMDNIYFSMFEGTPDNGEHDCIQRDFDILRTIGEDTFTIFMELWLDHDKNPERDELLLNLGQEHRGGLQMFYAMDGTNRKLYISDYINQYEIDADECEINEVIFLTTVVENSRVQVYCTPSAVLKLDVLMEINILRSNLWIAKPSSEHSGFNSFDTGCVIATQIWNRELSSAEIEDISITSVTRPSRSPTHMPSAQPTIALVRDFEHTCASNTETTYDLERVLNDHAFTIHMQVDLRAEHRREDAGDVGYALTLGPKDVTGSFAWLWDSTNERNLVFKVIGGESLTLDVWGCQHIATTYDASYVKIYCDNVERAELYVFDVMDITNAELHVGGHPFGRCITEVDIRSWVIDANDMMSIYSQSTSTTFEPSQTPSKAPVTNMAYLRIFDESHHDENKQNACIYKYTPLEVDFTPVYGNWYSIHVQTKLLDESESFSYQTIFQMDSLVVEWNKNTNTIAVRDFNGVTLISNTHSGLLCEHLTTSFIMQAKELQQFELYCESQRVLSSNSVSGNFDWVNFEISVGTYQNFCAKEVEMWERKLETYEIGLLAIFPEFNKTIGECDRVCGGGNRIQRVVGCTSYHWGCDHLEGASSTPIPCDNDPCQTLERQPGFVLTNMATILCDDCVIEDLEETCEASNQNICGSDVADACRENDDCAGFSIAQDGTIKYYNDLDRMAETTAYDYTTSVYMKEVTECGNNTIAALLAVLRLFPLEGIEVFTLGSPFDVNVKIGPFEEFKATIEIDCDVLNNFGISFEFPDGTPAIGNILSLNSLVYSDNTYEADITLTFSSSESSSVDFYGLVSASEFVISAKSAGDGIEIIDGISIKNLSLELGPDTLRASGTFEFASSVEATAELVYIEHEDGSKDWTVTAFTSGIAEFGSVLFVEDLAMVFEKSDNSYSLQASLGEATLDHEALGDPIKISGDITYESDSKEYSISARLAEDSPISIYSFSLSDITVDFAKSASEPVGCGESSETSGEGFYASFKGAFEYAFTDSDSGTLRMLMTLVYSAGTWMASTEYDSGNELEMFKDVFLTDASICTTVSDDNVYLELGAGARWDYEDDQTFEVSGSLIYDGDYFTATLWIGEDDESSFSMPEPFPQSIRIESLKISYSGRDKAMSGAVVMSYNSWILTANVDISSTSKGFELGVEDALVSDFLNLFDKDTTSWMPSRIETFFDNCEMDGRLGWNSITGFEGELTFTYTPTNKALSFWFMYNKDNYSFLVKLPDASQLGSKHSETVTSVASDDGTNTYMIGYSKDDLLASKGPKELGGQLFEDGLPVPGGVSVQVYVDTRPPTNGAKDNRVGIVKFIHDELKIHEITLSLALDDNEAELKISLGVDWKLWEFEIYQIELSIIVEKAALNVALTVNAWCNLVEPAISTYGTIMFGYANGQFELGIGFGFEGIIYDAFGVDGLMLKDVGFEGIIATLPAFPYIQPKGLFLQGYACIDDDTCAGVMVYFSSSSPSAYYVAVEGRNWYLKDFIEWKMPKMKNKKLLNKIGFKKFELEIGASLEGSLSGKTQFKRLDGSPVRRFDGSVLTLPGPMFRIDIEDFDFGIISGSRFMVDLTLGKNPKFRTEVDLDEINLGLFSIRDGQCRKRKGPRMKLEAWQGHFLLEAEGGVYKWSNCIGLTAKVNKEEISGCIKIDLRVRVKYPSCKCKWKGWKLKCKCYTKYKLIGLYESLCASVGISSGGRRALSTDEDWVPDTSDMGAELWELREEILRKNGHRIKVIHDTLSEYNGVYADETGETYMGFPIYRRLDNPDHIIHRFCVVDTTNSCQESEDQPWVLTNIGEARSDIIPISYAYPTSMANENIDNDKPWRVFWDSLTVRWMSNFGSTEIAFRDRGLFKYQGEMRNGAPLYRDINDPSMILFEGDNTGDGLDDVSNRWIVAMQTEDSEGDEILEPKVRSDYMLNENDGPWETNWPQDENDFRHSLHSHIWAGNDLSEVPYNQWKAAIHIEDGANVDFAYDGQAWDQTDRFDSDGSRVEPGYYRYPIQAIKISMNGVDRFFKLYLSDDDWRWPGFAGYTLKDLLTSGVAQNTFDGVFYEHNEDNTDDLWDLFQSINETAINSTMPTPAPTSIGVPSFGEYCVNGGNLAALDVNVNEPEKNIFGRIAIRRGDCLSYEGIGLGQNVSAGYVDFEGFNTTRLKATVYVLPLPPACSTFCPTGHLVENNLGHWDCEEDVPGEIYCDCDTFLDGDVCSECPVNMWVGDSHHRLTYCSPERCTEECDEGEHLALVSVSKACTNHSEGTILTNGNAQCFDRTDYEEELQCVEDFGETICDCEHYLSEQGACEPCAVGTWVGKSAHTLDETYCVAMRLGEVPERTTYTMAKGFVPEDRPNILEILEQTTHIDLLDETYINDEIKIDGARADTLFGDFLDITVNPTWDTEDYIRALVNALDRMHDDIKSSGELTAAEVANFDHFAAYYHKEKEVGFLAMEVDALVDKCIRHQIFCFVLNMVHREMLAAEYQLQELKEFTDTLAVGNLKWDADGVARRGLPSMFYEKGYSNGFFSMFHELKAQMATAQAYFLVRDSTIISEILDEMRTNLTDAWDPRVYVENLTIPSSSFMDSERTEYYPIHGVLNLEALDLTASFDMQKRIATNSDDAEVAIEDMMGDVRRDIAIAYIREKYAKMRPVDCTAQPKHRYLATKFPITEADRKTEDLVNGGATWSLDSDDLIYDIIACTEVPRLTADRYQSNWEVWHHQAQEYRYIARSNAQWDLSRQAVPGEVLLDEFELDQIETINTESEMSSGAFCIPEGRAPINKECCFGLALNTESGLCETPCTQPGGNPWSDGFLTPCCVSDDAPMINGTQYECAHPECAGEGETYSVTTPCCDGYVESEIVLTTGDSAKICVTAPTLGVDTMESAAPLFYRSQGCESIIVEAERLMLSGDFSVRNELHGYAFGGYIEYDGESSGAKFDVRGVYEYGSVEIRFRSNEATVMHLIVNGVSHDVMFHATSGDDWDIVSVSVVFDSDITLLNRVELEQAGDVVSPMIDRIQITGACSPYTEFAGVFHRKCGDSNYQCSKSEAEAVCSAEGMTLCSESQLIRDGLSNGPSACAFMWTSSSDTFGMYIGLGTPGCGSYGVLSKTSKSYGGVGQFNAACCEIDIPTQYHYVGPGYCRSDDCANGDCQVKGYYKQADFEYTPDYDSLPEILRQRSIREPNMFVSSDAECKAQCDSDDNCIGYSIADEDYEFPGRCIVHVTETSNMPPIGWRPLERDSTDIVFSSRDEGVHCYSKIVVCEDTCSEDAVWFDCDGDGILDPTCYDNGFEVQLSSKACKVSTTCSVSNDVFESDDSMCLEPYGESDLENNINAYCMGVEYTPERIDPEACDASETFLVKLALANTMFKECDSICLYDVYTPDSKAYVWIEEENCWDSLWNNDAAAQKCFENNDDEFEFAIKRVEQFCPGTYECINQACNTTGLVADVAGLVGDADYALLEDLDCISCAAMCQSYPGFECSKFECDPLSQSADCILYNAGVCTVDPSAPSFSSNALCSFVPYFPEIQTVSFGEIKINFQPSYVDAPDGYFVDFGEEFKLHDNGYQYGWNTDLQAYARDRNGLGTVDSTLMINAGTNWMIALPEGRYNIEIGYSDPTNDVETRQCSVGAVKISVGTVPAGQTVSTHINVKIDDGGILYVGTGNGCDSFSYIIVRSGWYESRYELGVPDSNECYGHQAKVESYSDCAAAAQELGMIIDGSTLDSPINPQGCFEMFGEVFYNTNSGGALYGRTPICERMYSLLIRQTIASKRWSKDEWEVNPMEPDNDNYAILDQIEDFRSNDGRFYFKLIWPNAAEDVTMEWSQTSNPLIENIAGYEAIDIQYDGRHWGGLEPSTQALMDGSVQHGNWFYAVGSYNLWNNGIPAYAKAEDDYNYAQDKVELYVQKRTDASCYAESYGNFLSGYATGATKCNPGFPICTLGEAKAYCDTLSDCGGVTQDKDGLYTLRKGTVLKKSPTGETTWWKLSECSDSYDSITQVGSNSDKCSPGHWLNQYPDHLDECAALVLADPSCDNTYFAHASFNDNNCWCVDVGTDCTSSLTYQSVVTTWKINGLNTGDRRQLNTKEQSTLENRLINLQN